MKKTLTLALLTLALPLTAHAGPGTDGGGHAFASTPADVAEVTGKIRNEILFGMISEAQTRQLLNPKYVSDPDVKKVLEAFVGNANGKASGVELLNDAMQSSYVTRPRCPAFDKNDADASTPFHRGAPICYSTKLLKRYPKEELPIEMATLTMHELAHHFGFNEDAANKFQNYMRKFVRDFLQFGKLNFKGTDLQYRELRPGGVAWLKTSSGSSRVLCIESEGSLEINGLGKGTVWDFTKMDMTIVQPGHWIVKFTLDGPVAISCRDYPTIDCEDDLYLDASKPGYTLVDAHEANICEGPARRGSNSEQETGGASSDTYNGASVR